MNNTAIEKSVQDFMTETFCIGPDFAIPFRIISNLSITAAMFGKAELTLQLNNMSSSLLRIACKDTEASAFIGDPQHGDYECVRRLPNVLANTRLCFNDLQKKHEQARSDLLEFIGGIDSMLNRFREITSEYRSQTQ